MFYRDKNMRPLRTRKINRPFRHSLAANWRTQRFLSAMYG